MIAMFFDLDGTLADTRTALTNSVNHTRKDCGLKPLDQMTVLSYVGQGAKKLLEHAVPNATWEQFMVRYLEHALDNVVPYSGVIDTLSELASRGIKLGINTAKPHDATIKILDHLNMLSFFGDAIIAGGDSTEMKPSAKTLIDCAMKMKHTITCDDWMIGDSWTDIGCAQNAGIKSAFCKFGFGNTRDYIPTICIAHMSELLSEVK